MKKYLKLLSLLLSFCLFASMLSVPAFAEDVMDGQTIVLYTANVRGSIDIYTKIAALKADYEAKGAEVILADAGNYLQGTVYASADCGETILSLMDKTVGYDVATIGSHEFDWNNSSTGTEAHGDFVQYKNLFTLSQETSFPMLSANVISDGEAAFTAGAVISTSSGLKVGFIGLTALTEGKTFPADCEIFNKLTFQTGKEMLSTANAAIDALDADAVICLSNFGTLSEDAVHADALVDVAAADEVAAGAIILGRDGTILSVETLDLNAYSGSDANVAAALDAVKMNNVNAQYAKTEVHLSGQDQASCKAETNLGDLWADALRWFAVEGGISSYYDEDDLSIGNTGIAVNSDHIVALWNGGNLKADISAGVITDTELKAVLPYPNKVAVVYMTGAQLLEALEAASQGLPFTSATANTCNAFMQVSGLHYTVNAAISYDAGDAYGNAWFKANSVSRVSIENVNGKALNPSATYAVITSNANFNGMDSSYIFKAAAEADERSTITTAAVRDVVWMYIKNELNSTIGKQYAQPQGRITVRLTSFTDVRDNAWYTDAVEFVTAQGLMSGFNSSQFAPDSPMTRAMLVSVLYRLAGSPEVETTETQWYAKARQWAMDNDVSDGTDMAGYVTRQQIASMLYRFTENVQSEGELSGFSDAGSVAVWAEDAMRWAVGTEILQGSGGMLQPDGVATRAQLAAILMRYINLK